MNSDIIDDVVSVIITETVDSLPDELIAYYKDLPGRAPAKHSKQVAATLARLDDDAAKRLVRDIVDATVFNLLYLIDVSFKDKNVSVTFQRGDVSTSPADHPLLECYRFKIDPGGGHGGDN